MVAASMYSPQQRKAVVELTKIIDISTEVSNKLYVIRVLPGGIAHK